MHPAVFNRLDTYTTWRQTLEQSLAAPDVELVTLWAVFNCRAACAVARASRSSGLIAMLDSQYIFLMVPGVAQGACPVRPLDCRSVMFAVIHIGMLYWARSCFCSSQTSTVPESCHC